MKTIELLVVLTRTMLTIAKVYYKLNIRFVAVVYEYW